MTLKDVAAKAGVSTATVSYVLNNRTDKVSEEVADRVRKIAQEMHYKPNIMAKALRSSNTNLIGVMVEDIATTQGSYLVKGINKYAGEHGYHLILYDLGLMDKIGAEYNRIFDFRAEIDTTMDIFQSVGVAGVIFVGTHDRDLTGLIRADRPIVYAYSHSTDEKDYVVRYDNKNISYDAVSKMIKKGHKKIGIISGDMDSWPVRQRMEGYTAALEEHGIPIEKAMITFGNWSIDSGVAACLSMLALKERPTAIFAMNDWMAIGAIREIKKCGYRIPEDIEIIGFDNTDAAGFLVEPGLSTIQIPLEEIGMKAAEFAIAQIEKKEVEQRCYEFPCELIERETFRTK